MAKTTPRLHVEASLAAQGEVLLPREQAHYLVNVLRLESGDPIRAFNAVDGEWLAYLTDVKKKDAAIRCERRLSEAVPPPDIDYLFAPLKHARLDYMIQKATELGVRRLRPVITARTIAERVNLERMRANAVEAAEQCNLVFVPEVVDAVPLAKVIASWESARGLIFCDETATAHNPLAALGATKLPVALLIGPEGGFTSEERALLKSLPFVTAMSLGPRILRADTAAIAALTILQASIGDWGTSQEL